MAKKLKDMIKKNPEPAKSSNVDPGQLGQYSATNQVSEDGSLNTFLSSRGINPKFVSRDTKISHAKSNEYKKWKQNHMFEETLIESALLDRYLSSRGINPKYLPTDKKIAYSKSNEFLTWKQSHMRESITTGREKGTDDTIRNTDSDSPTKSRAEILKKAMKHYKITTPPGALKREGSQTPMLTPEGTQPSALERFRKAAKKRGEKHKEIETRMKAQHQKGKENMKGAIDRLQKHMNKEENALEEAKHYPYRFRATYHDPDTDKMTHVMDFNHRSLEAAKKHAEGSRLQRRDGKEDKLHSVVQMKEEQIDEISKSTLASYKDKSTSSLKNAQANRDAAEHGKNMSKSFADLHKKSDAIAKKRVKGLKGYLQRKTGMKPTSEDVGDPKAAVNADGLPNPQLEPVSEKKKQMSKSARMIKALYKKKGVVKEDIYDHEKEDKSVATYGKKPKMEKADKDESIGEKKPQAALTLTGGKTLTGTERDTVEIDPMMRNRPGQPDVTKKDDKKDDKKKDEKKDK